MAYNWTKYRYSTTGGDRLQLPVTDVLPNGLHTGPGVYILETPPWPLGGDISQCHLGEKIGKVEEKKVENVKEKGRNGKENEKRGSKRVK
jgi:hypothetical protein